MGYPNDPHRLGNRIPPNLRQNFDLTQNPRRLGNMDPARTGVPGMPATGIEQLNAQGESAQADFTNTRTLGCQQVIRTVTLTTAVGSVLVLPSNLQRQYLFLLNTGGADIWIMYDGQAAVLNGIPLYTPAGFYEPAIPPTSAVYAFSTGSTLSVIEG